MFRPCIDLHEGRVKQIVGGTLAEGQAPRTNFVSDRPSSWFADRYRQDGLSGGHVIMLGPGNEQSALDALRAYPGGLQVGGGINTANARDYLDGGASHVIVTSWIFREGKIDGTRLQELIAAVGRERLVLDLSCRKRGSQYFVVTDRWQRFTDLAISEATLNALAIHCAEFLVHAVDIEGLCQGIDAELVQLLGQSCPIPVTYAGGAKSMQDLEQVTQLSNGRVDLTIGSALDIFGGTGVKYSDAVAFNQRQAASKDA